MHRMTRRGISRSRALPTTTRARQAAALAVAVATALLAACGSSADAEDPATASDDGRTGANRAGCVDGVDAGEDLFPDRFEVAHADNLSIAYHDTYKVMTVGEPAPDQPEQTYVLVQCGTETPALDGDLAGATVVEIPVRSLYSESTSHLGFIDALGVSDVVTGVSNADIVTTAGVVERIDDGEVETFAEEYEPNTELVIAGDPDVYVTGGTEDPAHQVLAEAGVPVVANAEWLETSPLGWSEWIAFFAALTNTEARATEVYSGIVERYEDAADLAAEVTDRPTVITGGLNEGDWYARGGAGIVPRFIADAGGAYVYADDPSTGSLILDIESVVADAADAAFWFGPIGFASRDEAVAADSRYGAFGAWQAGGVWNSTRQADEATGANAYFDQGPVQPDEVLLDYVQILHPELLPDRELVFFEQLPAS